MELSKLPKNSKLIVTKKNEFSVYQDSVSKKKIYFKILDKTKTLETCKNDFRGWLLLSFFQKYGNNSGLSKMMQDFESAEYIEIAC